MQLKEMQSNINKLEHHKSELMVSAALQFLDFFSCYSANKIIFLSLFNSFISLTCQVCCLLMGTYYVFSCCFMLPSIAVVWGVHSFVEIVFSSSL